MTLDEFIDLFFPKWSKGWQPVGNPGFSTGEASYISLYVYNGTPYVAYVDEAHGSNATVMVYKRVMVSK
ncbi:hypothetical protein [Thermospira aquatica]|uniref:Uncharacterized protein n=1 Tax=Thermospira aquatica TaxID=2828656 RepID=A0AAX3BG22_9SPIR|nr:hypothetical protein [Thermospira aquatica]URA11293.1 hypothetical protein KDW03_05715 [Thermospira aquatica]